MQQYIILLFLIATSTLQLTAQEKGSFRIFTNPTSASITLDGFPDIQKTSPAEYSLYRALTYRIKISKFNYHDLDTIVNCIPDSITEYHFNLIPKTSTLNVTTIPVARIYLDDEFIGASPIKDYPLICGSYMVKIVYDNNAVFSNRHIISEYGPCDIHHEYSSTFSTNKKETSYLPTTKDTLYFEKAFIDQISPYSMEEEPAAEISKSDFGYFGFYSMIGSNGTKGATWRYGLDVMHYIRFWGEKNNISNTSGVGLEVVIPKELNRFAAYGKLGIVARSYHDNDKNITTSFIDCGGGISFKPSPHFQLFGEFEFDFYNFETPDEITAWKDQFPSHTSIAGWLGIRVAF